MERKALLFVRRIATFLKQVKRNAAIRRFLPQEYTEAFEEYKDIKSIDRIQAASWIGFTLSIVLFGLDIYRLVNGKFEEFPYNRYLFYFHLIMFLFIVPAVYITKRKAWIIQTRLRRGVVIWGMVVFCFIAILAHAGMVYYWRDTMTMFIGFVFTSSWMFAMSHRERVVFFTCTIVFMSGVILYKQLGDHTAEVLAQMEVSANRDKWIVNLIEVSFFSLIAFFFDAFDYNLRVSNFLSQRQIEMEQQRIRDLEAFKARFFTNLTHEFRTPLTVILGMAREIAENPGKWAESGTAQIRVHAQNLLSLINQILDLSRIENNAMPLKMVQDDITSFIGVIMDAYKGQAVLKRITIHYLPPPMPIIMDYDPDKLATILANLLSNAIKFTPEDGHIYANVFLQQHDGADRLSISIRDSGIGIPKEELESIFERFYQVSNDQSRAGIGTGIGLSLARELTQLAGGDIEVSSTVGKGTQFTILLPVSRNAPRVEIQVPAIMDGFTANFQTTLPVTGDADKADFSKPDLLVIEDHPDVITYLRLCLSDIFNIEVSKHGEEGIRKAMEMVPDIIISDVLMPLKDGFAVCRELKQNPVTSHIPIILLSAKTDTAARVEGLESGADIYMLKPFDKDELRAQVRNLLDRYRRYHTRYENPVQIANDGEPEIKEDEFITRVRNVILARLDDSEFSVFDLERGVFLSRSQLHKKLKALTGLSATQFINRVRLTNARALIMQDGASISDIAYQVGYTDPNYFTRIYVDTFGETPSETRKQHKIKAL